ncbi:recombinase RecA [Umezawaea sp. Da 62-37]|uniref:recombinase RecA n=1 Tax=Umezawaea sp. Da 62-37 TaxID=3075927 RepID=UPI0028F6C85D|nr:recombinase RecA [Umezawaea sp. Da 62-37]WNV89449.1 recombinase RecA [Umezawaea sp. Da 62-37]
MTEQPEVNVRELSDVPSIEVISKAAVMLLSASAERLGLADEDPETSPRRDLDEARRLITALAGLITSSLEYLGPHAGPLRDGLQSVQRAFREASVVQDAPGAGPGEKYTGPVY